jgi:hypothetical protein
VVAARDGGVALIIVAFAEKLAQPDLGLKLLDKYPHFNVAREIGLDWTDLEFIRVAGSIDLRHDARAAGLRLDPSLRPLTSTLWPWGRALPGPEPTPRAAPAS